MQVTFVDAASPQVADQRITLSAALPVVRQELTLTLTAPASAAGVTGRILAEDGAVAHQAAAEAQAHGLVIRWTPQRTGFYSLEFLEGERVLARHRFPVVWRDLYFFLWPQPTPEMAWQFPYLTSTVFTKPGDQAAWNQLGRRAIATVYYRGRDIASYLQRGDHEGAVQYLYERWVAPLEQGADGIFIDEFGSYPDDVGLQRIAVTGEVLARLRQAYPKAMLLPAIGGALLPQQAVACKHADAIALLEAYPDFAVSTFGTHSFGEYLRNRIEVARHTDLIFERGYLHGEASNDPASWRKHSALILLSMNTVGRGNLEEPSVASLESYVRQIKRMGPEMPGIGFYGANNALAYHREHGLLEAAERLIETYYIKPVIRIREVLFEDYQPIAGRPNRVHVGLENLGGMDARDVRITVHARHSLRGEVEAIGTVTLDRLGTGFEALTRQGKEGDYEFQEVEGDTFVVLEGQNTIFRARSTRSLDWTPRHDGPYEIVAVVERSPQYTVLDGLMTHGILVDAAAKD